MDDLEDEGIAIEDEGNDIEDEGIAIEDEGIGNDYSTEGPLLCTYCGQFFDRNDTLYLHLCVTRVVGDTNSVHAPTVPFAGTSSLATAAGNGNTSADAAAAEDSAFDCRRLEGLRNPERLWFRPLGRRQIRVGGGNENSNVNGIYAVFEGTVSGVSTDQLPIGPINTRITHYVHRNDFNERNFWDVVRNHIIPAYNGRPGIRMSVVVLPRHFSNNDRPPL